MQLIDVLLSAFGGATVALLVVGFLGRKFIELNTMRALKKYENELEQKSTILKTEMSIYAHEQNVGLSRIDQQRSKAIELIYSIIMQWHEVFIEITQPHEPKQPNNEARLQRWRTIAQHFIKVSDDLSKAVRNNAIYFDEKSYDVIAGFGMEVSNLSVAFYDGTLGTIDPSKEPEYDALFDLITTERRKLGAAGSARFAQLRSALTDEFRGLMRAR